MATERSNTELKVFLNGDYESQYSQLPDTYKEGSVFFDKTRRAVYAEGVLITSDVVDVKVEGSVLKVKKVGESTYKELADLAIPNVFVKFTKDQGLTIAEQKFARANIGVKDAVDNLTSTDTIAPLSANQGRALNESKVDKVNGSRLMTETEGTKLAGIEEGAQKNVINSVQAADEEASLTTVDTDTLKLMGNLMSSSDTDIQAGKISYNFSARYDNAAHKIYFFNTADAPETGLSGKIAEIDATQFIKDGVVDDVTYNPDTKILTISFNTSSGKQDVPLDLTGLVDTYTAGDGLTVANNQFSANLGNGLQFDSSNPKKITLKPAPNGGLNVTTQGLAIKSGYGLDIDDNNEIFVDIDTNNGLKWTAEGRFGVDFTKAPVQSVNGQTGVVNIDVTPKVWSF